MITLSSDNWEINNVSAVIFDKDGTLIDSHIYWGRVIERRTAAVLKKFSLNDSFFSELSLRMGYSLEQHRLIPEGPIAIKERDIVIKNVLDYLLTLGIKTSEQEISLLFTNEHKAFLNEMLSYIKILPGVNEFLKTIKECNVKIALITSDSIETTNEALVFLGLDNFFDLVLGKESTREPKRTGVPVTKVLEVLKLNQDETVCIGDAPVDLIMASNSCIRAGIGVVSGQVEEGELLKFSPYVVKSLQQIKIS